MAVAIKLGPTVKLYEHFGIQLPGETNGSDQFVTDCPFCGREAHFYINSGTTQFQCKDGTCAIEGNAYSFMEKLYGVSLSETTPNALKRLSDKRKGFKRDAFIQSRIAWNAGLSSWLLPIRNEKGKLTNLLKYNGEGPWLGAVGCSQHLYGLDTLKPEGPIFLCEGQWDAIALRWLLRHSDNAPASWSVLGAPGASSLPKADLIHLQNRDIYILYDHDEAGRNGTKLACKKLQAVADGIYIMAWPENTQDKTDIEDIIRDNPVRPEDLLSQLLGQFFHYTEGVDPTVAPPELVRTEIGELYKDFEDTGIFMYDGLKDCLALALAVICSTRLQGEPLWLYAIGDPGRGKSLVLESTLGSHSCIYRTSVNAKSFISGFKDQNHEDKSLLALLPGKALIVKDYSNVLSLPHQEQDLLVSLLREAYDGRISRTWGNQFYREYPPVDSPFKDCRFSLVAGVTKEIHARNHAGLGERFLKYEIPCTEADNMQAMLAALDDSWKTHEKQLHRTVSVKAFLDRSIDLTQLPTIPQWFKERIICLSQFVGLCRSPVSRTKGDLDFAPTPESGTRVAKQLLKLSQALCLVFNLKTANAEVYRLVRKVAWDTSHGWRRELFLHLFDRADGDDGWTNSISRDTGFSLSTVHRQLHDMLALGILTRRKDTDTEVFWALKPSMREILEKAKLGEV